MNRSIKLLAYTLFALGLPLWIFLGNFGGNKEDSLTIKVEPATLSKLTQLTGSPDTNNRNNSTNNYLQIQTLLSQTEKTSKAVQDLTDILKQRWPSPYTPQNSNVTITGIPNTITVLNKNTSDSQERKILPNSDSLSLIKIKNTINAIEDEIETKMNDPFILQEVIRIFDINVFSKSINEKLLLKNICCKDDSIFRAQKDKELNDQIVLLDNLKTAKGLLGNILNVDNISRVRRVLEQYYNAQSLLCNQKVILIGIRNTSNIDISISSWNSSYRFNYYNTNLLDSINKEYPTLGYITLKPNDVAYFKYLINCNTKLSTLPEQSYFTFEYFSTNSNSPFRKKEKKISYFNLIVFK